MDYEEERRSERFWLRVGPQFKADLERAAKAERRPVADWVRLQLEQRLLESKAKLQDPR